MASAAAIEKLARIKGKARKVRDPTAAAKPAATKRAATLDPLKLFKAEATRDLWDFLGESGLLDLGRPKARSVRQTFGRRVGDLIERARSGPG